MALVGGCTMAHAAQVLPDFRMLTWQTDPRPILARGDAGSIDQRVVGDPCIVWDDAVSTWRMFYFASGEDPKTHARGPRTAMALAASVDAIDAGDWAKQGLVSFSNPEALINPNDYHKWWVVMDAERPNRASRIDGRYWAVFTASIRLADGRMHKHLQAAHATALAGPWTLLAEPIVAPGTGADLDALHADTPTAFWLEDRKTVALYYMAYPVEAQALQPKAPFGSGMMLATWRPGEKHAHKLRVILRPGRQDTWADGWMASPQLFRTAGAGRWYALTNASPTPPQDRSHREPAPSLGGWLDCDGHPMDGVWTTETERSPFRRPEQLSSAELEGGLGVNFWRHHLLVTPAGKVRIFFNSGAYGREQMYALVPR